MDTRYCLNGLCRTFPAVIVVLASQSLFAADVSHGTVAASISPLKQVPLDEVVVTGSRLRSSAQEEPSPITVFDRTSIDQTGMTTVADVLRFLPQQSYNFVQGRNFGSAAFADLRGLGTGTTLVLINGRRVVPSAASVSANAFDLNALPLSSVERVEVLTDSASAIYGADALGGVVNVILKRDIAQPTIDLRYGTADGGGRERRVSGSAGMSSERVHAALVLDYLTQDVLRGGTRERWRDQDYRRFGSVDRRSVNANPGNVTSLTTANLPGLNGTLAAVPASGAAQPSIADFVATTGQVNRSSLNSFASIVPEVDRKSVAAFVDVDLSGSVNAFVELLYADTRAQSEYEPSSLSGISVPASNAFNPFGVAVRTNYLFTALGSEQNIVASELWRAAAGLRGSLSRWEWEVSAVRSDEDGRSWNANVVDRALAAAALASSDPLTALNVFQSGPGASSAVLTSLLAKPAYSDYGSAGTQASGLLRGEIYQLPAGPLATAIGAEWRKEEILQRSTGFAVANERTVRAAFAELRVPIVAAAMDVAGVDALSLNLAVRQDHYSDFGDTTNPQYGLLWQVTPALLVRGTYSTGFRAPSLFELYAPVSRRVGNQVVDTRRNNEVVSVAALAGGNPNLDPITAESFSAGVVLTPAFAKGLRIASSYWRIQMQDRVATFLPTLVVANESLFPSRIVRNPPSPADTAQGLPGTIESVDSTRVNFGLLNTQGIDFDATYPIGSGFGDFSPRLAATWVQQYDSVQVPGGASVNRVALGNSAGTVPRWRGVASLGWSQRMFSASITARYVHGYAEASLFDTPTGKHVASQTLFDVQGAIDFATAPSTWLQGLQLSAGVLNAFDAAPRFTATTVAGYDPSQGDLRQRFGYISLTKSF